MTPNLQKTFNKFKESSYKNIEGIIHIDSGIKGPCVGLTACTHGNEPSGLVVFEHLLNNINLKQGSVFLVVNNLKATERYLKSKSKSEEQQSRFCDINMNRLPKNLLTIKEVKKYEILRAQQLYPVWKKFTHAVDIHSTTNDLPPMIIGRDNFFHEKLFRGIPIETLISNIDKVQIGSPAFSFYGRNKKTSSVFAIEAGTHKSEESFKRAVTTVDALLINLGMVNGETKKNVENYKEYKIFDSIIFPDLSYKVADKLEDFKVLRKGGVFAQDNFKKQIKIDRNACAIMISPQPKRKKDLREEIMFLSYPPKIRKCS